MQDGNNLEDVTTNTTLDNSTKVIQTDIDSIDGQTKCPKCGATDISTNIKTGKLKCKFCRYEFLPEKVKGLDEDTNLTGTILGSGAQDIDFDSNGIVTLKCSSCGAEVVVDTNEATSSRCHWCRNVLSINKQVPNGSVPDVLLPFKVTKDDARSEIEKFVGKRKFFAHPKFKQEFTTENIMGVYFPYMVVDINCHTKLIGQGEHLVRRYTVGSGDDRETRYDADLYDVEREFDLFIDDLTIESSTDKLDNNSKDKTNNIINSIMPFDTENCVKFDANYLRGFTSEKRDTNVDVLQPLIKSQAKDISKFSINDTLKNYDRGVCWNNHELDVKGEQWKSAYLPVWLYSYQQVNGSKKLLHYVAVNARTKETMGSVPIHMPKLLLISLFVEIFGFIIFLFLDDFDYNWLFLLTGAGYFAFMYARYRNSGARHKYETETKTNVENLRKVDRFVKHRTGLSNSRMSGANNKSISGKQSLGSKVLNGIEIDESLVDLVKNKIDKKDD